MTENIDAQVNQVMNDPNTPNDAMAAIEHAMKSQQAQVTGSQQPQHQPEQVQQVQPAVQPMVQSQDTQYIPQEPAQGQEQNYQQPDNSLTEIEQVAAKIGWNKNHTGSNAVSAEDYILRGREINDGMSKKVKNMSRELAATREAIDVIQDQFVQQKQSEEARLNAEIKKLEAENQRAADNEDFDAFKTTNEQISELNKARAAMQSRTVPQRTAPNPAFVDWKESNVWYDQNPQMKQWADNWYATDPSLQALPKEKALERISNEARKNYPEAFNNQPQNYPSYNSQQQAQQQYQQQFTGSRPAQSQVAAPTQGIPPTTQSNAPKLSHEQMRVAQQMVERGVFKSVDEYAVKRAKLENVPVGQSYTTNM